MRLLLALIVIVYLVGVGVVLSPTIQAKWNSGTASELMASIGDELPHAVTWPATLYRSLAGERRAESQPSSLKP
jgi:hypothetical protein